MSKREDTWKHILQALYDAHTYAYCLDGEEYQEIIKLTQHFCDSAKWHKKQFE